MTRRKPRPTEGEPARRTDDAERSAREASQLLGLGDDPSRLCPADRLRCDLVATLRIAIDHAGATAMEGGSADVGRLVSAVEQLTRLLPKAATEAPSHRADPRKALLEMILTMRERGELSDRAMEPITGCAADPTVITPSEADVVPPGELADRDPGMRPGPDDPKPPVTIEGKAAPAAEDMVDLRAGYNDTPEPWREHLNRHYDPWADNR
jgi:hypothetical protein